MTRLSTCVASLVATLCLTLAWPCQAQTTLKFSAYFSADNFLYVRIMTPFMREIEQKSGGKIRFEEYPNAALGKMTDQLDLLRNSIADIAMFIPSYSKGRFNYASAASLPFAFDSSPQGTAVLNELTEKWFQKELKDVKILFQYTPSPSGILTRSKAVDSIDSLKGMKMRSAGAAMTDMLKLTGANIVTVPLPEIYVALERGVVDGTILDPVTTTNYKLHEIAKFYTPLDFSNVVATIGMGNRAFDRLTPEQQGIVLAAAGKAASQLGPLYVEKGLESQAIMRKANVKIVEFPKDERERFKKMVEPLWEKWVKDMEAQGVQATAFMADFRKSIAAHRNLSN